MKPLNLFTRSRPQVPQPVEPAPVPKSYQGYIDALSAWHVAGWARNLDDAHERATIEVSLRGTGEVLARDQANLFYPGMREIGIGDGQHAYHVRFNRQLRPDEQQDLIVRPINGSEPLIRSDHLSHAYEPIVYVIMDIVDNCNLRCPFCLYDYSKTFTTHAMTEATFDAAVGLAPFISPGGFWFSCLHEPALHPRLADFIAKVPMEYRSKVFYTTNLAKRMPLSYFQLLGDSGLHHINLSIESLDPPIYEKMRKGARFRIFKENWDHLVEAFRHGSAPPKLRYISLAYKSTYRELPALVDYLLREREASIVEIRHTYDEPHIPRAFRKEEYMGRDEWLWLRDQLAHYTAEEVMLTLPPGVEDPAFDQRSADWSEYISSIYDDGKSAPASAPPPAPEPFRGRLPKGFLPGRYGLSLSWDGRLEVKAVWGDSDQPAPPELRLATTNVRDIPDVGAFLATLPI